MEHSEVLHKIDKRLAVLEALSDSHSEHTDQRFDKLEKQNEEVKKELANLKIKVAGISSAVSIFIIGAAKALGTFPW